MSIFVPFAMFGWIPVVLGFFALIRPAHRAVIAAYLFAWLFLPMATYKVVGLPDYTKMSATTYGVMVGIVLFDTSRLLRFRPRWFDVPVVVWCLVPMASSLSNGLGAYDGASGVLNYTVTWGLPYFIGRLYFDKPAAIRDLAMGLVIGGLIYVPLCLYEIRMSPQLHRMIYGYHQHSFAQTMRFGGYRPTVFMQHGLMVGMWMACTTLVAFWMWFRGGMRRLWGFSASWFVLTLFVTTIMCKSFGAIALMLLAVPVLFVAGNRRWAWPALLLIAMVPGYIALRSLDLWHGEQVIEMARRVAERRAESFAGRLRNEDMLVDKALQRPLVGWGGWGRSRVYNEEGKDISVTDGLWVIALGTNGLIGVTSVFAMLLIPPWLAFRASAERGVPPDLRAILRVLSVVVILYAIDCLPNAMINPIFTLTTGALGAISVGLATTHSRRIVAVAAARQRGAGTGRAYAVKRSGKPGAIRD